MRQPAPSERAGSHIQGPPAGAVGLLTRTTVTGAPRTSRHRFMAALRLDGVMLGAAVVIGTVARTVDLGEVGLNSDEAVYAGQAASLAGNPHFTELFPVVRAHPLMFQVLISAFYRTGIPELPGRYGAAAFGVGTIVATYLAGRLLYRPRVGAIAALLLAVMPYHVVVSRQVLLDGPMTFFTTLALVCLAALGRSGSPRWLVGAAASLGLAVLTKESALVLLGSMFVLVALVPRLGRPRGHLLAAIGTGAALVLAYPLVTAMAGGARTGQSYLLWQLTRRPNHGFAFYLTAVAPAIGVLVLGLVVVGILLRRSRWQEVALIAWVVVPLVFFEVWPVKGFPYLVMLTPALALLAARPLGWLAEAAAGSRLRAAGASAALVAVLLTLAVPTTRAVTSPTSSGLAGAGGSPGGREAGLWVAGNLPVGARLMTIGPSMANILQYYSGRAALGLSVSPNPVHRNPVYQPIRNPDAALRDGEFQYVVWDAYSAARSPTFAARQLAMVAKFDGRVVHVELARFQGRAAQPVVVIYEVHQ